MFKIFHENTKQTRAFCCCKNKEPIYLKELLPYVFKKRNLFLAIVAVVSRSIVGGDIKQKSKTVEGANVCFNLLVLFKYTRERNLSFLCFKFLFYHSLHCWSEIRIGKTLFRELFEQTTSRQTQNIAL